jgi:hypothetical protein
MSGPTSNLLRDSRGRYISRQASTTQFDIVANESDNPANLSIASNAATAPLTSTAATSSTIFASNTPNVPGVLPQAASPSASEAATDTNTAHACVPLSEVHRTVTEFVDSQPRLSSVLIPELVARLSSLSVSSITEEEHPSPTPTPGPSQSPTRPVPPPTLNHYIPHGLHNYRWSPSLPGSNLTPDDADLDSEPNVLVIPNQQPFNPSTM